ncbi:MAG: hypothetical protein U5R49_20485 [Deltaproteobacteria bacterium]|nr:hypothetical protein [Deltaproteobacteria bacterium]
MKCPKCAYVSFDYNDACPKCGNSLTTERNEMNLPPFKPNPPFLLDSLVGGKKGTPEMTEAQEAADFQTDQEELVANLDQLAQAYKEPEYPQDQALVFDATEETPEAEAISLELGPDASEEEELRFDIEPEQPETEAFEDDSTPEVLQSEPEGIDPSDIQVEFELDQALKEAETPGDSVWDTEALEKKMAEVGKQAATPPEADESPDKKTDGDTDEFIIELDEIEPLEMDIETEPSDEKDRE